MSIQLLSDLSNLQSSQYSVNQANPYTKLPQVQCIKLTETHVVEVNDKCHYAILKFCFHIGLVKDIKAERRNKSKTGTNYFSFAVHDNYTSKKEILYTSSCTSKKEPIQQLECFSQNQESISFEIFGQGDTAFAVKKRKSS